MRVNAQDPIPKLNLMNLVQTREDSER